MSESNMNSATTSSAGRQAALATGIFAAFGTWSALTRVSEWPVSTPLVVFYGILLLNTYYSVRCFASLAPPDNRLQRLINLTLVGIYAALAASFAEPLRFVGTATVLFAVATLKYTVLIGRVGADALLARKLRVDALGTIACAWALGGMLGGHSREAAWLLTGACAVANVYLLWVRPLYRSATAEVQSAIT